MKIKPGFILKNVAGSNIVLPVGAAADFNGMITLNESGAFLWKHLEKDTTEAALKEAVLAAFADTEEAYAEECVRDFIKKLRESDLLTE